MGICEPGMWETPGFVLRKLQVGWGLVRYRECMGR